MKINLSLPILAGALVSAIIPIASFAQTRSRVVITNVKVDMVYEWLGLPI
jgi:hypothetical protein